MEEQFSGGVPVEDILTCENEGEWGGCSLCFRKRRQHLVVLFGVFPGPIGMPVLSQKAKR